MSLRFALNIEKAAQTIVWLADKRPGITLHTLLKVLFFADKRHLNEHGRPIVGDDYRAMQHGPVASNVYDLLKHDLLAMEWLDAPVLPFTVQGHKVHPTDKPLLDVFSESDIACLEWSLKQYGHLPFGELTRLSHEEKAWQEAKGGHWMRYEDFLDDPSDEKIEDLQEYARRVVL